MDWITITLETRAEHTEQLSQQLAAAGAIAVTLRGGGEAALYEPAPGEIPLWGEVHVEGLFEAGISVEAVMRQLHSSTDRGQIIRHRAVPLADRPWERTCLDAFRPMRFGDRTWIRPSWEPVPSDPEAVVIDLDPGLAFGTGSHATTALCLEWLDRNPVFGQQVIDYGCGSGILAIAALKHGAARSWAVDHDPQAITATLANAEKNGVAPLIVTCPPARLDAPAVDLLLANILAGPLMELAPRFAELVRPGGVVVMSGLLTEQYDALRAVYDPWFDIEAVLEREGWLAVQGRRRVPPAAGPGDTPT